MANLCERLLGSCLGVDCDNSIFQGIDSKCWIFNKSEVTLEFSQTEPNIVSNIVMKTYGDGSEEYDATGYTITQTGKTPFTGTNIAMTEGNVQNKWTNQFNFILPDNSPKAAEILDSISNGKFVVVFKNDFDGSDHRGQYQVFGSKRGLVATEINCEKYNDETDSSWNITLTEEGNPLSAVFMEHLDGTTPDTEAFLDSICVCE